MGTITEAELKKQIKSRRFSPAYMLYGSEQMYIKRYASLLRDAVAGKDANEFNCHTFGGEVDLSELAAALQMVAFMSEYNCVVISDVFLDSMDSDSVSRLKEIVSKPHEGTVLIFSMPSYVPSKNAAAFRQIVKAIGKIGSVIEFEKPAQSVLERCVAKWANENGKTVSAAVAAKLISSCGDDLNLLKNETYKICAYASGSEITHEDVDKLATVNLEARIFTLSDAVLNGDGEKAFRTLDILFYQKEEPITMLYVLSTSYIDAYRIRVADECGVGKDEAARDFEYKNRAFTLEKARRATRGVSTEALRKSLDALVEADILFKSASVNYRLCMERLIAQLLLIAREGKRV